MEQSIQHATHRHGQSKLWSWFEVGANYASGVILSTILAPTIMHVFGYAVPTSKALGITLTFTAVSILRSYIWRRIFNHREIRK